MDVIMTSPVLGLNPKIINAKHVKHAFIPSISSRMIHFSLQRKCAAQEFVRRTNNRSLQAVFATLSGVKDLEASSSHFEDFSVTNTSSSLDKELKISIEVSGAKTRLIFDDVFDKMVAAAQPIPGFRRVKGGKTPNIPRDILLEILGPSKVYEQVIKNIINSTVAEYVQKNDLKVSKSLKVEQSFEELEESFEPGETLSFDAVLQLVE